MSVEKRLDELAKRITLFACSDWTGPEMYEECMTALAAAAAAQREADVAICKRRGRLLVTAANVAGKHGKVDEMNRDSIAAVEAEVCAAAIRSAR